MSLIIPRNFKRAKAMDAQFKVGDKVRVNASYSGNVNNGIGKVVKVDGSSDIVVEFAGHGTVRVPVAYAKLVKSAADSRAADSIADKEREHTRLYELAQKNITFYAAKGDSAKVAEWKRKADEYKRLAQEAEDAAGREEINNAADLRTAVAKMADIAKRLTGANVSFKAGWTPEGVGEISLEFPDSESARRYNYYKLFNAWEAAESQIAPRWATGFSGFKIPRVDGNRMIIGVLHFTT